MKVHVFLSLTLLTLFAFGTAAFYSIPDPIESEWESKLEKRNQMAFKAMGKLSNQEYSAILSLMSDVNVSTALASSKKKSKYDLKKLKEVIAAMKNHPKFQAPKWMAADGSTFDSYGRYLEHQWGVPYPSEFNPFNPFE